MKKIFMTIVAVAAIAACSKTEVQYENSAEIGFAPVVKNVTKAAMTGNLLTANPDQQLGVWAYWNYDGTNVLGTHSVEYLSDATFAKKDVTLGSTTVSAWGGYGYSYPWPTNGTLKFAGYTKPSNAVSVSYSGVDSDNLTFTNYTQTNGFDLCWFNATTEYNNRSTGEAIPVTLSHALSWLTFKIKGQGTVGWKINKIVLNDIATVGTGVCHGTGVDAAQWTCADDAYTSNITLLSSDLVLTETLVDIENGANNILVIPQLINKSGKTGTDRTHTLTINYSFPVGDSNVDGNWKSDTKVVNLDLISSGTPIDNEWKSGIHYTYNLTFKSNEILVSPSYGVWDTTVDNGVTIE